MILTKYGVESASFVDMRAFYHWFATCRRHRAYFIANQREMLRLLREKQRQISIDGQRKCHIWWRRNYVIINNALRIETLMQFFLAKMNGLFQAMRNLDNDATDPNDVSMVLCHLPDLSPLLDNEPRLMCHYFYKLLKQCRVLIHARYGWKLFIINHVKNKFLKFPWLVKQHYADDQLSIGICAHRLKFTKY
jgi:hypothetical protein